MHGQTCVYKNSAEGIIHIGKNLKPVTDELRPDDSVLENADFHLVHMGGLRPFLTGIPFELFENDGLTGRLPYDTEDKFYEATGTPKLGQYLIIEANEGSVTFRYRNTGILPGYTTNDKPEEYTVKLK